MRDEEFFAVRLTVFHHSWCLFMFSCVRNLIDRFLRQLQTRKKETVLKKKTSLTFKTTKTDHVTMCQQLLILLNGDEMTDLALTGPLLWLCTVKSGQKSRSAMARSSDSASGRAPSSSSSSSVWKRWTGMRPDPYDDHCSLPVIKINYANGEMEKVFIAWQKLFSTAEITLQHYISCSTKKKSQIYLLETGMRKPI